jgi:hypothetical protein
LLNLSACENVPLSVEVEAADYIAAAEAPENAEIDVSSEETKLDEIEYKTIEPPEDGWTLEKFNEVFYINGKQVDFPLSISDLDDNYEYIDDYNDDSPKKNTGGELFYQDQKIALVHYYGDTERVFTSDTKISALITFGSLFNNSTEENNVFVLNGIKLNTPKEEVLNSLGSDYKLVGEGIYVYYLDESDNSFSLTFTKNTETLNSILVYIEEV